MKCPHLCCSTHGYFFYFIIFFKYLQESLSWLKRQRKQVTIFIHCWALQRSISPKTNTRKHLCTSFAQLEWEFSQKSKLGADVLRDIIRCFYMQRQSLLWDCTLETKPDIDWLYCICLFSVNKKQFWKICAQTSQSTSTFFFQILMWKWSLENRKVNVVALFLGGTKMD